MTEKIGLLMVDPQIDFCPGGALPVADGNRVMEPLNRVSQVVRRLENGLVVASRDWHPQRTTHFANYGGVWPEHCIKGTKGARFRPSLNLEEAVVVSKGMGAHEDAYSAFDARDQQGNKLEDILRRAGIRKLAVGGLATDYCVKASVLGGLKKGFRIALLTDAIRAVNLKPNDGKEAIVEMEIAGARITTSRRLIEHCLSM